MILDLKQLGVKDTIEFNYDVLKDDELDKRIIDLKNASVKGIIYTNGSNDIVLDCNFLGQMIIKDSVTLDNIPYDFDIHIEENLEDIEKDYLDVYDFSKNTLDLKAILWQNIVLEVPMSYSLAKDAELKGNGWELINENTKNDEVDPRLEVFKDLLKGDD